MLYVYHCEMVSLMQNTEDFHLIGSSQHGLLSFINYWNGFTNCRIYSSSSLTLITKVICYQSTMTIIWLLPLEKLDRFYDFCWNAKVLHFVHVHYSLTFANCSITLFCYSVESRLADVGTGRWLDIDDLWVAGSHMYGRCVVVVGSRSTVRADLTPSGISCGVETSLASPTLVVWVWLEASYLGADCGRCPIRGGGESAMVLGGR